MTCFPWRLGGKWYSNSLLLLRKTEICIEQKERTISPSDAASMCVTGAMRAEKQPESSDLMLSYVTKNAAARTKHKHSLFIYCLHECTHKKKNRKWSSSVSKLNSCFVAVKSDEWRVYRLEKIPQQQRARRRRCPWIPRPCGSPADSVNAS